MSVGVGSAPEIDKCWDMAEADGGVNQPISPDPAESIRDNHAAAERSCKHASRLVWILRQKRHGVGALDVRLVHSGIGTDKAMMGFANQNLATHTNDSL